MINEAVFRSPKWLRDFVDFEVNTGEDIKGEPSKSELERRRNKEWKTKWDRIKRDDKISFIEDYLNYDLRRHNSSIINDFLSRIENDFMGDQSFMDEYDKWLSKKIEENQRQKKIIDTLNQLHDSIWSDYIKNPHGDKFKTPNDRHGNRYWEYRFENGKICHLSPSTNKLEFDGITYTLNIEFKNKFIELANRIGETKQRPRNANNRNNSSNTKTNQTKADPNRERYEKLKGIVKIREEQLYKMSSRDPNRPSLQNELDAYKQKLRSMKSEYKFESLMSFSNFSKF